MPPKASWDIMLVEYTNDNFNYLTSTLFISVASFFYHIVTMTSTYNLNRLQIFSSILFYHTSSIHKDGTRSFFIRSPALSSRVVSSPGAVFWAFQIIPQDSFAGFLKKYFFDEARAMRVEWSQSTIEHLWEVLLNIYIRFISLKYVFVQVDSQHLWIEYYLIWRWYVNVWCYHHI